MAKPKSRRTRRYQVKRVSHATSVRITRRDFLRVTGGSLAAGQLAGWIAGCEPDKAKEKDEKNQTDDVIEAVYHEIVRPDDLLTLRMRFVDIERVEDELVVMGEEPLIVFEFPRQHILEEAVNERKASEEGLPKPPPVNSLISGVSRVVFSLPEEVKTIDYSLTAILDLVRSCPLSVSENALPPDVPRFSLSADAFKALGLMVNDTNQVALNPSQLPQLTPAERMGARRMLTAANVVQQQEPSILPPRLPDIVDLLRDGPTVPKEPEQNETSIELPFRLLMSPNHYGRFVHAIDPVKGPDDWIELWHSRLATAIDVGEDENSRSIILEGEHPMCTARALWVRGQQFDPEDVSVNPKDEPDFGLQSINPKQRNNIVHQTSNYKLSNQKTGLPERPVPVDVKLMMLSSLGGWLDVDGKWNATYKETPDDSIGKINTIGWTHRATMGRDQFVRIVTEGFLFPWGHRAVLIQISERKINPQIEPGLQTAFLFKRQFLIIKEVTKSYQTNTQGKIQEYLRALPFSSIQFRDPVTPDLDLPEVPRIKIPAFLNPDDESASDADQIFLPKINSKLYRFPVNAIDRAGHIIAFDAGAVWVPGVPRCLFWSDLEGDAETAYIEEARKNFFNGQRIAFAESDSDNTTFETQSITFGDANLCDSEAQNSGIDLPFVPVMEEAELAVEALRAFADADSLLSYEYSQPYVEYGFDEENNKGQLFLQLTNNTSLGVNFEDGGTDRSGGFLSPNMQIKGLSRVCGPVGFGDDNQDGINAVAQGSFNPANLFKDAKLFGAISLTEIIDIGGLEKAPTFVTDTLDEVDAVLKDLYRLQGFLGNDFESYSNDLATIISDINDYNSEGIQKLKDLDLVSLQNDLSSANISASNKRLINEAIARVGECIAAAESLETALEAARNAIEMAKNQTVRFEFTTPLNEHPILVTGAELTLAAEIRAKAIGSKPAGADVICCLDNFTINLFGEDPAFAIEFDHMQFIARAGQKPDVDVVLNGIRFGGPLKFINSIKDIIPLDGFSDPPIIDVSPEGLAANFSLPLPNIAIGIFSLENLAIGAGFEIPFLGDGIGINFFFCTRENPFTLSVSMLGGGGFVGMQLSPAGIRLLEISFEFGASLSIDLGVASGGVSIMAGMYFAVQNNDAILEGYLRIRGEVDVLGLISASIELSMSLTYESATGKVTGRAEITIEVTVLCFSGEVSVSAERKFAGSNGDPTFAEIMQPCDPPALPTEMCGTGPTPWSEYVNAFA